MQLKFKKLESAARCPARANESDAGYDLFSTESCVIQPMERKVISVGISVEIPEGYYGRVAPRSGLAVKRGGDVLAGVIDSGYRGEIILKFDATGDFHYNVGDRVGQLMLMENPSIHFVEVVNLPGSDRGDGGFGSTGL